MTQITTSHHRRGLMLAAPFLAGALLVGACSKSEPNTSSGNNAATTTAAAAKSTTPSTGGSSATTGTTPGTTKASTSLNGLKVWYKGFRYDLGEIRYDSEKQEVSIKTKVTNLGNDPATAVPPAALINGGEQIARGSLEQSATITGGKTVDDTFLFANVANFTVAGTSLVLSDGSAYQEVKVPLDGKGETVTLEPVEQKEAVAPIVIGNVTVTPTKVEVRYDLPNNHSFEADAGTAVLLITATTKNAGTSTAYYNEAGVTVTTNTGTYPAQFIAGDSVPAGQTEEKTTFYFNPKTPVEGEWTLDLKDQPFGDESAPVSASSKVKVTVQKSTTGTTR